MGATWSVTSLADILDPVADSIERGNDRLTDIARQESGTVLGTILNFAIDANGKRVRPALVFLATELFGKVDDGAVDLAAATECLHSATLVHDDIVDGADSRRGREAVHVNWSEGAAVLTGDYLFAAAAGLVGGLDMPRIMTLFAETIMQISRSEFDEPTYGPDGELMMGDYVAKIEGKTASLFRLCCEAAAVLADGDEERQRAMRAYGLNLGVAFQIADDILDVTGDADVIGKPVGGDLQRGLLTSPTIHFLQTAGSDKTAVARFYGDGAPAGEGLHEALNELDQSGAVASARADAERFGQKARDSLAGFADDPYLRALEGLTHYVISRAS
jgi:octaprenyl-diphosphate synthase